jgi:hypothetical protein
MANLTVRDLVTLLERDSSKLHDIALFLTGRGTMLQARLFREHYWTPALRAAGLDVDPHQGRHWFVTNACATLNPLPSTTPICGVGRINWLITWRGKPVIAHSPLTSTSSVVKHSWILLCRFTTR